MLQNEHCLQQEEMKTMNTQITLLHKEKKLSRAEHISMIQQLQQYSRTTPDILTNTTPDIPTNTTDNTATVDLKQSILNATITKDITATQELSSTLEMMLNTYNELDEDSRKMLIQHSITTNNTTLQQRLMELKATQGNKTSLAKLTKKIIKFADTYKVPEL
jgi:hypothetical protein